MLGAEWLPPVRTVDEFRLELEIQGVVAVFSSDCDIVVPRLEYVRAGRGERCTSEFACIEIIIR
jgi:hypothetical protein